MNKSSHRGVNNSSWYKMLNKTNKTTYVLDITTEKKRLESIN